MKYQLEQYWRADESPSIVMTDDNVDFLKENAESWCIRKNYGEIEWFQDFALSSVDWQGEIKSNAFAYVIRGIDDSKTSKELHSK